MPAKSKAQQRFFAMALHSPEKMRRMKPHMSEEDMHHMAETKRKGLPERKGGKSKGKRK